MLRQACRALWHGDGRNRFFDKSLQLIVFSNGKAGFNGEVRYAMPHQRLAHTPLLVKDFCALFRTRRL